MNSHSQQQFAIIGGGISGLSAAQRLAERSPNALVTVFEASPRLGGVIQSTSCDGYLFEHAADSFIVSPDLPWAGELCEKLGLELIETASEHRGAAILRAGRLHPVPAGLQLMTLHRYGPLLRSPLLSRAGKMRVLAERFISAKRDGEEESLAQFTRRRYGKEMFEQIVQPLVSGIYTADPERLSMSAALPQFLQKEKKFGSLFEAAKHAPQQEDAQGARYGLFRSPRHGMQGLIDGLESELAESGVKIRKETPVANVKRHADQWQVRLTHHGEEAFDGVVLATPIRAIPKLIAEVHQQAAELAEQVEHVGTAIVCLGFHVDQLARPLTCFGSVIPHVEGRKILAISHTNIKFPARVPEDHVLLRVFVGGALQPELLDLDDEALLQCVRDELSSLMGISGSPVCFKIVRWPGSTPQYNLGHRNRIQAIQDTIAKLQGLEMANNALRGVGIPQCVRSGWDAADHLLASCDN